MITAYAIAGLLTAAWFLVVTWPIAAPEKGWGFLALGAVLSLILWPVAVVGLVVTRPAKRSFAPFLLLLLCIVSACTKRPSPPPAALPGVEAVDVKTPAPPKITSAPAKTFQPVHNLYFDTNVDTLKKGQVKLLVKLAEWAEGRAIVVTGYADTVGSSDDNMALSLRRAQSVASRLPGAVAVGKGETTQFGDDDRNRRVTLEVR